MKVRVFGTLRSIVGDSKELEVHVDGTSTAGEMLSQLAVTYPGLKDKVLGEGQNLRGGVNILVNGRSVRFLDGLRTLVEEGDELALFPPIGGG